MVSSTKTLSDSKKNHHCWNDGQYSKYRARYEKIVLLYDIGLSTTFILFFDGLWLKNLGYLLSSVHS